MPSFIVIAVIGAALAAGGAQAADAVRGQSLYQQHCTACHSIDYNGVGPAHKGLFGRIAGKLPDYSYSPALQGSSIVWNADSLDKWLRNPEKLVPGQKMGFMVPSARDRADLIAYLKAATAAP
jgi:cytochrome c